MSYNRDRIILNDMREEIMLSTLPLYEVEFLPSEQRLKDRRKEARSGYFGVERRRSQGRRATEQSLARPLSRSVI